MSRFIGIVSAYAYAVSQGYTGTEEEYAELMASYATVAEQAEESAESASQSATQAGVSAQTATTKASEASQSATQAGTKASQASTSATQASASATSASQSAQTATTKASEASASASTAGTKASDASQSASTASTKASEASASATSAQTAQGLAESARDDAVDAKTDAESARDLAQQYAESIDPEKIYSAYPTDTASGSVASFADGADDIPMKSVVVNIEPVQSGSGDPSPDNVRPISGWTGVNVVRTGKNLFDGTFLNLAFAHLSDGNIIKRNSIYRSLYVRVVGGYTYTISRKAIETNRFRVCATIDEPEDGVPIKELAVSSTNDSLYSITVTVPEGYNYLFVYLSNESATCTPDNYQIELGSTATEYEPYTGNTYSITFPSEAGTVYGGTLDVTKGVLTVDRAMVTVDENDDIMYASNSNGFLFYCINKCTGAKNYGAQICDRLSLAKSGSASAIYSAESSFVGYPNGVLYFKVNTSIATVADMKSYLSSAGALQACYELATPITYQLTPTEIKSLLGDNNVWADAGDTEVTYRADTVMYIDKKLGKDAPMIATGNIVSGSYFMVGSNLYKATANIASGAAVVVGTNATAKTMAEALNEINA